MFMYCHKKLYTEENDSMLMFGCSNSKDSLKDLVSFGEPSTDFWWCFGGKSERLSATQKICLVHDGQMVRKLCEIESII